MEFPVEVTVSTWNSTGHMFFGAIIRDITARRLTEQRRAAQYAVTRVLAESPTLAQAAAKLLQTICESLGWDIGLLWGVDEQMDKLRCLDVWHAPEVREESVGGFSREQLFRRGSGLLGRVWANGEPLWLDAVQPDEDLLQMLGAIGSQVGQFIERTQAQAALDTAYAKMEAILGSMPCALLIVNCNLQITYANPTASRYFSSGGERRTLTECSLTDLIGPLTSDS